MGVVQAYQSDTAIATLDPDQYRGTIGLPADAPASSQWPHHTSFPAANKGMWLRVVSNTTISGKALAIGQEWICSADGTAADAVDKWELDQIAIPQIAMVETFTLVGHSFEAGSILKRRATDPIWSLAYLTEFSFTTFNDVLVPSAFGNLLVVAVTTNTFSISKYKGLVSLPAHGLGEAGDLLFLNWSSSVDNRGKLTKSSPRPGDPVVKIATVFDENTLDYNPDNSYEILV